MDDGLRCSEIQKSFSSLRRGNIFTSSTNYPRRRGRSIRPNALRESAASQARLCSNMSTHTYDPMKKREERRKNKRIIVAAVVIVFLSIDYRGIDLLDENDIIEAHLQLYLLFSSSTHHSLILHDVMIFSSSLIVLSVRSSVHFAL